MKCIIYSRDGEPVYEGVATSIRAFIEQLANTGHSLAGTDLSGLDLSSLNLNNLDFSGADLSRANLRAATMQGALLKDAVLSDANLHGADLRSAQCQGAYMEGARMAGIRCDNANFRGANLDRADMTDGVMNNTVWSYASVKAAILRDAQLRDADFGNTTVLRSDLRGVDLCSNGQLPEAHQPDRTRRAVVVGCQYDKMTRLPDKGADAFRKDRAQSKVARTALAATTSLAALGVLAGADAMLPEMAAIGSRIGQNIDVSLQVVVVAGVSGFMLLKEMAADTLKDAMANTLGRFQQKCREAVDTLINRGSNLADIVLTCGSARSLNPIRRALAATKEQETGNAFSYFMSGSLGAFIICDRKHLASALGAISSNRNRGYSLSKEILLLRKPDKDDDETVPVAIRFHKDGTTTAVWTEDGKPANVVLYDAEGQADARLDLQTGMGTTDVGDIPNANDLLRTTRAFERKLLTDNGLENFHYPEDTHYLQAGMDNSILVRRIADRVLDNPEEAAVITADGQRWRFLDGQQEEWVPNQPQPKRQRKERESKKSYLGADDLDLDSLAEALRPA